MLISLSNNDNYIYDNFFLLSLTQLLKNLAPWLNSSINCIYKLILGLKLKVFKILNSNELIAQSIS